VLRELVIGTNAKIAAQMGINQSTAITTVKPSGTVSQLTGTSSGMHPWHNDYYIRSVRQDNKDPLTQFLKDAGVPNEPELNRPDDTTVFYFPTKAPEGAVTRKDLTAIEHLEFWKVYKQHWTEHDPSITVSVKEHEWIGVANWVYNNWDIVGGISFMPYADHVYQQAPYTDTDESGYRQFKEDSPASIDWSILPFYESEDNTSGTQTLSCSAGSCELVGSADK
jgi:ribonucleoside-diphosphate reductase alpha chain